MNEIVNRFLLVGDKFMPEMHIKQPAFTYGACGLNLMKQEIQDIFTKMNQIKLVSSMI